MINQKMIDEVEDKFADMDTTPENVQWFFEKLMEFVTDEDFAEEAFNGRIHFDSLGGFPDEYDSKIHDDFIGYDCFTEEQAKELNEVIKDECEGLYEAWEIQDDMRRNPWAYLPD